MDTSTKITVGAIASLVLLLGLTRIGVDSDSVSSGYGGKLVADPPTITVLESEKTITWDDWEDSEEEPETEEPPAETPKEEVARAPAPKRAPERKPTSTPKREREPAPGARARTAPVEERARTEAPAEALPEPTRPPSAPKKFKPRAFLLRTRMVITKVGKGVPKPSVVAALQDSIKSVELCVEAVAKAAHRKISGSIPVSAQIDSNGRLRGLKIESSYAGSEACLRKVYTQTAFPGSNHGGSDLEFTVEFETSR